MDDTNLLIRLDRVQAPLDFERRVMAQLAQRKTGQAQAHRSLVFRYSLAGAAVALLVFFIVLNVFVLRNNGSFQMAGRELAESPAAGGYMPITETVDYSREMRSASREPQTVFILEQVSSASNTLIKY
jgi:hypothetical protein